MLICELPTPLVLRHSGASKPRSEEADSRRERTNGKDGERKCKAENVRESGWVCKRPPINNLAPVSNLI